MQYVIIEHFRNGDAVAVYRRFRERGRLAPDGLRYVGSWVTQDFARCYQVMECDDPALLEAWMANWRDLVDFEVIPAMTSAEAAATAAPTTTTDSPADGGGREPAISASKAASEAATVARELLDAWNRRDWARFEQLVHHDVEWYDPAMPQPPVRDRAAARAFGESILRAFPDFRYEVQEPICSSADGSRCAIPWRVTATHLGPLDPPGFAPSGRQFRQEGVDMIDVRDGRVSRIMTCFDSLAAAGQLLGVTVRPEQGTFGERALVLLQRVMAARVRGTLLP